MELIFVAFIFGEPGYILKKFTKKGQVRNKTVIGFHHNAPRRKEILYCPEC